MHFVAPVHRTATKWLIKSICKVWVTNCATQLPKNVTPEARSLSRRCHWLLIMEWGALCNSIGLIRVKGLRLYASFLGHQELALSFGISLWQPRGNTRPMDSKRALPPVWNVSDIGCVNQTNSARVKCFGILGVWIKLIVLGWSVSGYGVCESN